MEISHIKATLGNGLDVIVHEDHKCPIVAVNVWYHVGSKNEHAGRTGFAHLFEHLMFEGSAHHDRGYFEPLQEAGGILNGSTSADRTNYWEVVPRDAFERALWMESDRMGFLLPALTQAKLDTQRDVVLNERRQNYENRPYGLAGMILLAAHYPASHPYHWPTIGFPDDLRSAGLDDVRAFFETYYCPANASLAIAGDVTADAAVAMARRYFEDLPGGRRSAPVSVPAPAVTTDRRLVLEDRVARPRLYLSWPAPALFAAGDAELDLLADILTGGKSSRLYRAFLHERQVATDVSAAQGSRELSGLFSVVATAASPHSLDTLEAGVMEALDRVATDGVTSAELQRARSRLEADWAWRCQSVGGFGGKADLLNSYNVFAGTPQFVAADFERYQRATSASIRDTVAALRSEPRVALSVVPAGDVTAALSGSGPAGDVAAALSGSGPADPATA